MLVQYVSLVLFKEGASVLDYIEKQLMSGMRISHYSEQEGLEKSIIQK
jgi:hypothetical protein